MTNHMHLIYKAKVKVTCFTTSNSFFLKHTSFMHIRNLTICSFYFSLEIYFQPMNIFVFIHILFVLFLYKWTLVDFFQSTNQSISTTQLVGGWIYRALPRVTQSIQWPSRNQKTCRIYSGCVSKSESHLASEMAWHSRWIYVSAHRQ